MPNRHKPIGNTEETSLSRYEETARIKNWNTGYKVVLIWGCEVRKLLWENHGLKNELSSRPFLKNSPFNIRDALYRSRTEATKTYYKVKQGEKINYVDVISLYPYICKYGKFPVGHTKVYLGAHCPPDWIGKGLWNVRFCILGNYHPVLPYKCTSKLMFPLCSCANTMNQGSCPHSNEERCIVGTWIVDDVRKAEDIGYGLVDVFEFWEYSVTFRQSYEFRWSFFWICWHVPETETVIIWLSILGSKWEWRRQVHWGLQACRGNCSRQGVNFQKLWAENFGKAAFKLNVGKWAQNQNKTQTTIVESEKVFYELLTSPGTEVTNLIFPNKVA